MRLPSSLLGKGRPVLGLDIGAGAVRAALVTFGSGRPVVRKLGQVALPPGAMSEGQVTRPDQVTQALKELRTGLGLGHLSCVIGCEQFRTFVRDVELPWVPDRERREALPLLAADLLPMAPEDAVVDFVELAESTTEDGGRIMLGLLVAASAEALMTLIAAVEASGLRVKSVDLSAFALVRSLASGSAEDSAPEALVDVGEGLTTVVIHTNGVPGFVRLLPTPAGAETSRLVEDIRSSLAYHVSAVSTGPLSRVAVSGGSVTAELMTELADSVRAPVVIESAFRNVDLGPIKLDQHQLRVMALTSGVCIGLALGEAA